MRKLLTILLSLFLMTSCVKDKSESFVLENYFSVGGEIYTTNPNKTSWNNQTNTLQILSNQGKILLLKFNSKPTVSKGYFVVTERDLPLSENNVSIIVLKNGLTPIPEYLSSGAPGYIMKISFIEGRILVDYANTELLYLFNGVMLKIISNGKFFTKVL